MSESIDIAEMALGIIRMSLAEDLGVEGDITSQAVCPEGSRGKGILVCREPCVVAGQPVAAKVFELAGEGADYRALLDDGGRAEAGQRIAEVSGPLLSILSGERTALNFLCHLSGVATLTSRMVELAEPYGVEVMDTRKTMPGMRLLEKYAVRVGGGTNHRTGLFDGVIVKDNHIVAAPGIELAVRRVKSRLGDLHPVEVEATSLAQVREAVDSGADIIMLDNMGPDLIEKAVALIGGRCRVEVSGGVNADNIVRLVRSGIDAVSIGFLTHSAPAVDISLDLSVI